MKTYIVICVWVVKTEFPPLFSLSMLNLGWCLRESSFFPFAIRERNGVYSLGRIWGGVYMSLRFRLQPGNAVVFTLQGKLGVVFT